MSRYTLLAPSPSDNREVVVGWDAPLSTYFLTVIDYNLEDDEQLVLDTGTSLKEITDLSGLAGLLKCETGLDIPTDIREKLSADANAPYVRGPMQDWVINVLRPIPVNRGLV